jgi:RNA polymerase sigma factor (TIGR02999 family)
MQDVPGNSDPAWAHAETYNGLRRLAASYLRRERRSHTLQPTALLHEGLTRVLAARGADGLAHGDFARGVARAMRMVLIDHARRRRAEKRGGKFARVPLDEAVARYDDASIDLLALDEALDRLARIDPELSRIIELRFFGGLTEAQVAEALGVSPRSVTRAWAFARLWLARELGGPCR